jgi:4-amino-4-deoxy-L-arabinose transferase-like glycosyltransferase
VLLLAGEPYSLSLTMFCLLGAALLLLRGDERNRWLEFAGAGALIGFGVLTRPSVVTVVAALVVVMGVLVWRRSRRSPARVRPLVARSAAFVAVLALVVVPVLHHNADHGQGWTVSTANEQNFWFGNNPYTPTYKTWELGQRAPTDPKARQYLERFGFHLGYYRSSSPSRAQRRAMLHEATRFIVHHPAITALRTLDRAQAFWGFDYTSSNDLRDTLGLTRAEHLPLVALEAGGWFIVALLAVVGLTSARYLIRTPIALFMLALVLGYALAYLAAYASGRWHEPVLGFVVPFAAAGAVWLMDTPGVTRRLRRNPAFLTLAFVFVIVQLVYAYAVATSI